jgi:hypothetical protein
MAGSSGQQYLVRDQEGNVYGPAEAELLRQWAAQGRIVPGMHIAARETGEWVEVSVHPALAGCFQAGGNEMPATEEPGQAEETKAAVATKAPEGAVVELVRQANAGSLTTVLGPATREQAVTYASVGPQQNVPAMISLIAGIVAAAGSPVGCVPVCSCLGVPLVGVAALVAIVLGIVGMAQVKGDGQRYAGRGKAVAGIVLGIASIVLSVGGLLAWVAMSRVSR